MIELNQQLCDELDLTYWQLNEENSQERSHTISREEKELLRKILLAKGISLSDEIIDIHDQGVVIVNIHNHQLIFDDVKLKDTNNITHLAKISEMLDSNEHKKHTWYKLKNVDL